MTPRRICLMRLSALGDVCLIVPLVRTLQNSFPEVQITWVIGQAAHALVSGLEGVEFIVIDKRRPIRNWFKFYSSMRKRQFDVLMAAQASFRAHLLLAAIRAPVRIGFDPATSKDFHGWFINQHVGSSRPQHLMDSFLAFAGAIGATKTAIEWRLPINNEDFHFADEQLAREGACWLAVNPAASKPERNWLPDRYAAVMNHVIEKLGWKVVVTGGPDLRERNLGRQVLAHVGNRDSVVNLIGLTTPKQLAAVLGRAKVLLAPDTGPVHIATAMGTPVIGLYAVASSTLSAPYFSRELLIDRYPDAVRKILGRDPQTVKWGTRVHSPKAMELISVDDALEKLSLFRERNPVRVG